MTADKSLDNLFVDLAHPDLVVTKPARKVLCDLDIALQGQQGVPTSLQIKGEALEDYAEMTSGHPASNEGAEE